MEIKGKVHLFFEQSGTFKNEFIKLGIPAEDYDIQNRNYCICNYCGHWFRKSKGIHSEGFDFCGGTCSEYAHLEAVAEADVCGGFEPHYYEET